MTKIVLATCVVFCFMTSCKSNDVADVAVGDCELFSIGSYSFYNARVYERPVMFQKGSNALLHDDYLPVWYPGYCAETLPSYFKDKASFLKYVSSEKIEAKSLAFYDDFYETNKTNTKGAKTFYYDDFHLLFRGTVSVKHGKTGKEYLLVAGKSYIAEEADYDKNTDFYERNVKSMFAFELENGVYKFVALDQVLGQFSKLQYDKVFDILDAKSIVNSVCIENVNNVKKTDFDSSKLPDWVYTKSEMDEY